MDKRADIDLNDARTSFESRVLSGRERGIECREIFKVKALDRTPDRIVVSIPRDIYSMNTSFFLGLFGESVRALGKQGFTTKYEFDCDKIHNETILDGVERALKEGAGMVRFISRTLSQCSN